MLQAALHFGWNDAAARITGPGGLTHLLKRLTESLDTASQTPLRVKALMNHYGDITVEAAAAPTVQRWNLYPERLPPLKSTVEMKVSLSTGGALTLGADDAVHGYPSRGEPWDVIPDAARTTPSPYTTYKTTNRNMYTSARERVRIRDFAEKREVLLVSDKDGEIMEGSLTSPFFWRNGQWTTPPLSSGGQAGTTRRWALEKGYVSDFMNSHESMDELIL